MKHFLTASFGFALCAAHVPAQAPSSVSAPLLEIRLVAAEDYEAAGVDFELAEEKKRLGAWLAKADNADKVRREPSRIESFNTLQSDSGGPASPHVRWLPRVVRPSRTSSERWEHAYSSGDDVSAVALFTPEQYSKGPKDKNARLVELLPINTHDRGFNGRDLDAGQVRAGVDPSTGLPSVYYGVSAARREAYAEWTGKNVGNASAIIIAGMVRSAPALRGRISGAGVIRGSFSKQEADELARLLKSDATPSTPDTLVQGEAGGAIPGGADPEDLRAMQGAQAMLEAERKLRDLIKSGKIAGIDRILTFEEIESWPYEDALLGMPKQVKKLDGKNVLMTGFMLPIDEVEDIKEFLLVQSLWSCCYGQPPDINGIVRVVMKGDARIDYQFDPIKVTGTFKVEATFEDGYCVDIFQLVADSVEVIK